MHARPVALGTSAAHSKRGACPWSCAHRQERSLRHPRDALSHLCVLSLGSLRARAGQGPEGSPGTEEGESSVGPVSTLCGGMARRGRS